MKLILQQRHLKICFEYEMDRHSTSHFKAVFFANIDYKLTLMLLASITFIHIRNMSIEN